MGVFVAMLDQQPVGALAAVAVVLQPNQDPAAAQPLPGEREFQLAAGERLLGRLAAFGLPIPAIP